MKRTLGTGFLVSFSLNILLPASLGLIRLEPEYQAVNEGQSVTFTCTVNEEGSPLINIRHGTVSLCSLQRDGSIFRKEPGVRCGRRTDDTSKYYLTLDQANRTYNTHNWTCTVGSSLSNQVRLEIRYPPNITSFTANGESTKLLASLGDDVTLGCHADANPKATVVIRRGRTQLSRKPNTKTSSSNLTSVSCRDMASYYCDASNNIGSRTSTVRLLVLCSPEDADPSRGPFSAAISEQVTLRLSVVAFPVPVFTWQGPSGEIIKVSNGSVNFDASYTDSTVISNVKKEDIGDYLVSVRNDIGVGNFTVSLKLKEGLSKGMLIGVIAGCVVLFVFVVIFICCIAQKLRRKRDIPDVAMDALYTDNKEERYSQRGDDVYTEVKKPKKKNNNMDIMPVENEGPKVGRDDDGLLYVGVDVADQPNDDVIKGSEEGQTQYADVEINILAKKLIDNEQQDL